MNNSKSRHRNDIFYLLVLILTLITFIMGITFTYYRLVQSEKKDSTKIQTGTLAINYIDGKSVGDFLFVPVNNPKFTDRYSVYRKKFSVASSGTLDQTLDIYIDVKENTFSEGALHYSIFTSDGIKIDTGAVALSGKFLIARDVYLKSREEREFLVLIWLQENNKLQDSEIGNTFSGSFDIIANQIKYQ